MNTQHTYGVNDGWRMAQPYIDSIMQRSCHQLKTATTGSQGGHAFALRPKLMRGLPGANSLAKYVSASCSGVSSCFKMSACCNNHKMQISVRTH